MSYSKSYMLEKGRSCILLIRKAGIGDYSDGKWLAQATRTFACYSFPDRRARVLDPLKAKYSLRMARTRKSYPGDLSDFPDLYLCLRRSLSASLDP